jgi:hypothetical protein
MWAGPPSGGPTDNEAARGRAMGMVQRWRDRRRQQVRAATAIPPDEALATAAVPDEAAVAGEAAAAGPLARLGALAVPDFRYLWLGSLVSNIGTWMQQIGSGWLVLQLTNSPFWLGLVSFAAALPILLFSLPAGVLADRVDRRRLLFATQGLAGALALAALAVGILARDPRRGAAPAAEAVTTMAAP